MSEPEDPEVRLAIAYAPAPARAGLNALWALDGTLGRIVTRGGNPLAVQLKLTWWYDALARLDAAPPAEPVLRALSGSGVPAAMLTRIAEGWEEVLDPAERHGAALDRHAAGRGGGLFAAAARLLGSGDAAVEQAGAGWALVDLSRRGLGPGLARAAPLLAPGRRWSRAGRPLGMLARLARRDVAAGIPERQGSPARVLAMARHAISGS